MLGMEQMEKCSPWRRLLGTRGDEGLGEMKVNNPQG